MGYGFRQLHSALEIGLFALLDRIGCRRIIQFFFASGQYARPAEETEERIRSQTYGKVDLALPHPIRTNCSPVFPAVPGIDDEYRLLPCEIHN